MQRTFLALALIAGASAAYAQTTSTPTRTVPSTQPETMPSTETMPSASGGPVIGRNDWVRQKGDQPGPKAGNEAGGMSSGATTSPGMASPGMGAPGKASRGMSSQGMSPGMATAPETAQRPGQPAMKDEYGRSYDAQGNRIDGRGRTISPQSK